MNTTARYSVSPAPEMAALLINNGILFVYGRDDKGDRRIFFIADEEIAQELNANTRWTICHETDDSFDGWTAIMP